LLEVKLLALRDELLPLVLETLAFPLHRRLQLLEVAQLYLELLHLGLHEESHQGLYFPFLDGRQVLGLDRGCGQGGCRRRL
jgi:hypothetical protein